MSVLTRKQFLKRSKECLNAEGVHALDMRGLIDNESAGNIDNKDAYRQIKSIMDSLESVFMNYERLNSPEKCVSLKRKILNSLIVLQESASANYDYVTLKIEGKLPVDAEIKIRDSKIFLDKFRTVFNPLTTEVEMLLTKR